MLSQLFSNSAIKNAAFSTLRKTMEEHNLKGIYVTRDEKGDFDFKFLNQDQIIIPEAEFQELKRGYQEYLKQ